MSYCQNCGTEIPEGAPVCPNCGCAAGDFPGQKQGKTIAAPQEKNGLRTAAKVFMILGCVFTAFYFLIPLCWTVPMTVSYCRRSAQGIPIGTGFKVCSLLFVNLVAGILMLCDDN